MKPAILALGLLLPCTSFGAVTLQFSNLADSLNNISNTAGTSAQNGLAWGIVIDTAGDNFSTPLVGQVGLSMSDGANLGNGYLFYFGDITKDVVGLEAGAGGITSAPNLEYASANNGKGFGIIWFDAPAGTDLTPGLNYGLITNNDFGSDPLITPDVDSGGTVNFASNFDGAQPLRPTNLLLVPEPSTALLGLLGLAGLLRRRR